MGQDQTARIEWRGAGIPVSTRFDDPYFSLEDGLAETRHVFLDGNDLPGRFHLDFRIAELGFGTGLNLLAAWQSWRDSGQAGRLHYTGFEAFPMAPDDLARALAAFPDLEDLAACLLAGWQRGDRVVEADDLHAEIIVGDARTTLPGWKGVAEAWFLDGFAPARNPEIWGAALMSEVARHTAPDGTFATYTAAGFVRRGLEAAGFEVTRCTGYGRKRHMSTGQLRPDA